MQLRLGGGGHWHWHVGLNDGFVRVAWAVAIREVMPAHLGLPDENGKHAPAVVGVPGCICCEPRAEGHMAWQRSRIVYSTASNHPKYFVTARHVIERLWAQPRGKSGNVVL